MNKTCGRCKHEKPIDEFNKNAASRDGHQRDCRTCTRKASLDSYHKNRDANRQSRYASRRDSADAAREYIVEYLSAHPCVDCGEPDIVVLDFDHVRGVKRKDVSVMACGGYSLDSVKAEIAKCEIRCANCHRRATIRRAGGNYRTRAVA